MANEITFVTSLLASKGGASINSIGATGAASKTVSMAGTYMGKSMQSIPTTAGGTLVVIPATVSTDARLNIRNLSALYNVKLSVGTGTGAAPNFVNGYFANIPPGEQIYVTYPTVAAVIVLYAQAVTAACDIEVSYCQI